MAYADDLLELARDLANLEPVNPRQACLRRAVSTAYYALFHLLISDATLNWARPELRSDLGRLFAHGKMKTACESRRSDIDRLLKGKELGIEERAVVEDLRIVAHTFIQTQDRRERADYDSGKDWTQTDVLIQVDQVAVAFESWSAIRETPVAQAFLVSLSGQKVIIGSSCTSTAGPPA